MKCFLFLLLSLMFVSCTKKKATIAPMSENKSVGTSRDMTCKTTCGVFDQKICDSLFEEYTTCHAKKTEPACTGFILAFSKALPKSVECTNTCSKTPFKMAITYSCDGVDASGYPKITERSAHLLSKLKFKSAIDLLLSDQFNAILDGALAEDIKPEIENHKK